MNTARAQEDQPPGPVYVVQEGDSIWGIAQRFNVSVTELSRLNDISDPGQLAIGTNLVIPGLDDVQGILVTGAVSYGENLRSLSRRYKISEDTLARLNRIITPASLFVGSNIILPEESFDQPVRQRVSPAPGESLLELAVKQNLNPWNLMTINEMQGSWETYAGESLLTPTVTSVDTPGGLPAAITNIEVETVPLIQGSTLVVRMQVQGGMDLTGTITDHMFPFFHDVERTYIGIQGIHAMAQPGFFPLIIRGNLDDGTPVSYSQWIYVRAGDFTFERLEVPPETIDPENTRPEEELWESLMVAATSERMWDGLFALPVSPLFAECYPSLYGNRRSYNGSPFNYFHSGLDFCGGVGQDVYAVGAGVVVFADFLTVRGNSTVIDHGWGVYSAYMHQSEIQVEVGEQVEAGQLIGLVGATGRVTGSHLHLEVIVNGVQVDPLDWLEREFP
ncbi:MAG: peptidoglycan DD-metalloendopeptidase family protein [Anaerolineales bacterium]|nr:peptidoglycan DD-metalloendopeptidase family protein [Anaerolineales bacterium]